jgi:hypothetical protein
MRIDGRLDMAAASLDVREKAQKPVGVIAFRKALPVHEVFPLEFRIGKEEAVRCDQFDLGRIRPARQQGLEHAGGGRFADRNRAGDADDIGNLAIVGAQKSLGRLEQALRRRDVKRQQSRQRQINGDDFFQRNRIIDRLKPFQVVNRQGQGRVGAQPRPFFTGEMPVGREIGSDRFGHVLCDGLPDDIVQRRLQDAPSPLTGAGGFLLMARLLGAPGEFIDHILQRNAAVLKQDQ